ncbi:MAG: hypothetical protein K9J79_08220 [Desulfobacteraceae bacterium]|nr:hypothetical protein [Desulfobacteraceae bacterium]
MTRKYFTVFIQTLNKRAMMLKVFLVCLLIVLGLLTLPAAAAHEQDALYKADLLYAERSMDSLKQSVTLYKQITQQHPDSYEAFWKASRSCRVIARMAVIGELDNLEQICKSFGKQGMELAQKAIALEPEKVEGHFYYAVNVGGYAKGASIWSILSEGLKDKAQKHLKKAYEIDIKYNGFVLLMHMGLYYEVLPWYAGQDKAKALEHYREALRLMPRQSLYRPQLHVLAGKLMLDQGVEETKARQLLRQAAASDSSYFSRKASEILAEHG